MKSCLNNGVRIDVILIDTSSHALLYLNALRPHYQWVGTRKTSLLSVSNGVTSFLHLTHRYVRHWTWSSLVHVMICRLFGAKPLPGPFMSIAPLGTNFNKRFNRNSTILLNKIHIKCLLQNGRLNVLVVPSNNERFLFSGTNFTITVWAHNWNIIKSSLL